MQARAERRIKRTSERLKNRVARFAVLVSFSAGLAALTTGCSCSDEKKNAPAPQASSKPVDIDSISATPEADNETAKIDPGCPESMARIKEFCIDRFEASLEFKDGAEHPHFIHPEDMGDLKAASRPGVYPQVFITRDQAASACSNAGKRLCTAEESLTACAGPENTKYTYGNEWSGTKCNLDKKDFLKKMFPDMADPDSSGKHHRSIKLATVPGYLALTGQYPECKNSYGVFDLSGNVAELVSDNGYGAGKILVVGTSFTKVGKKGCNYQFGKYEAGHYDFRTGFRCCTGADGAESKAEVAKKEEPDAGARISKAGKSYVKPGRFAKCPEDMAPVSERLCMDKYEALVLTPDGQVHPHNISDLPKDMEGYKAASRKGVYPHGHMDQIRSHFACKNAGKRLCLHEEQEMAFMGLVFPYGNTHIAHNCNAGIKTDTGQHPLDILFPTIPHAQRFSKQFNDPRLTGAAPELGPETNLAQLALTGSFGECITEMGHADLTGNLSEWMDEVKVGGRWTRMTDLGPGVINALWKMMDARGVFAGEPTTRSGEGGVYYYTSAHHPAWRDYSTGFRCCLEVR